LGVSVNHYITEKDKKLCMSNYSQLAAKRYRLYMKQKQRQSLIQDLVAFSLMILQAFAGTLQNAGIRMGRRVEKVNVELEY